MVRDLAVNDSQTTRTMPPSKNPDYRSDHQSSIPIQTRSGEGTLNTRSFDAASTYHYLSLRGETCENFDESLPKGNYRCFIIPAEDEARDYCFGLVGQSGMFCLNKNCSTRHHGKQVVSANKGDIFIRKSKTLAFCEPSTNVESFDRDLIENWKSNFATVDQWGKIFNLIQAANVLSLEQMRQQSLKSTLDRKQRAMFTHENFEDYNDYKRTTDTVEHDILTNKHLTSVFTNRETGMDDTVRVLKKMKSNNTSFSIYSDSFLEFDKSEIEDFKPGIESKPYLFEESFYGPNIRSTLGESTSKFKDLSKDLKNQNFFELQELLLDLKEVNKGHDSLVHKAQNDELAVALWDSQYEELIKYQQLNGNCKVPLKYNENPKLAKWAKNQRTSYRKLVRGEQSPLNEERKKRLDDIGFVWELIVYVPWEKRYKEIVEYKKLHGDCKVPYSKLGVWVMNQRASYKRFLKGEKSYLSEERKKKLDDIGFIFYC